MAGEAPGGALRQIFARFATVFDSAPLEKGDKAVDSLTDRLSSLGSQLAGAAIVVGIQNFVAGIAAAGDELDKQSQALGLSTRALQEWRSAAGHAGVSAEQLAPAIQALRRNADAATHGGGMAADFRRLGVTLRDEHGTLKDSDTLLREVADGMQDMDDPTRRAALAMRLMGDSGALLLPLLANGSAGVQEAADAFQALGGGMSDEAIAASAEYTDRMQDMDEALTGIKSRIGIFVLPAITRLAEGLARGQAAFSAIADRGYLLETVLGAIAIAATAAAGSTIVAWVAAAAPFVVLGVLVGGLILLVEDLWVGFKGGKSVLAESGNDIDAWAMNAQGWLEPVAGAWLLIRDAIRAVVQELAAITGVSDDLLGLNVAGVDTTQRGGAMAEVRRIREERAAQAEADRARREANGGLLFRTSGVIDAPALGGAAVGGGDRVLGTLGASASPFQYGGGAQVTQNVALTVNANGLSEDAATRVAERAVSRALSAQADDMDETLAGQGA